MKQLGERAQRIVASAIALAEDGGFEAVRLRDIAAHAQVALGTVYKRFSSKEDILVAVLEHEVERLEAWLRLQPVEGDDGLSRLTSFFERLTAAFFRKPKLARAALRAAAAGDPSLASKVGRFHARMTTLIAEAVVTAGLDREAGGLTEAEVQTLAYLLSQVWFAALVGWMGGLFDQDAVIEQVRTACRLLLRGLAREG
ncbi:MAG: TetR/AcrR family transcriptional regulator [Deltaproteobacteria bacterium]|nr:TetR/AcrR family transcriptional regulator [Deltaproteobacteria bacterium]